MRSSNVGRTCGNGMLGGRTLNCLNRFQMTVVNGRKAVSPGNPLLPDVLNNASTWSVVDETRLIQLPQRSAKLF